MLKRFLTLLALAAPLPAAALEVVTDIPPVQSLVATVTGEGLPTVLMRAGGTPHDLALRPSDAAALERAEAVFWIGPALSPGLEKAMATLAQGARVVSLLEAPGTARIADEDHGTDPHAWLDPANGIAWLSVIAETLAEIDPANAALYRANAAAGQARIAAAGDEARAWLLPPPSFALAHDAFAYFAAAFGVAPVAALSDTDAHAPGPQRVDHVLDTLARQRPACILAEPGTAPAALAALTEAAGARVVPLDLLTAGQAPGPALYPGLFTAIAAALSACHR